MKPEPPKHRLGGDSTFFHTNHPATPITKYSVLHTGANTQLGGFQEGLLRDVYQLGICGAVAKLPRTPAARQMATNPTKAAACRGVDLTGLGFILT